MGISLALFIRFLAELIIIRQKNSPDGPTASSTALAREIVTWLFTGMYLGFLGLLARELRQDNKGVKGRNALENEVRQWIFESLESVTEGGRRPAPPFHSLVDTFRGAHGGQDEKLAYADHLNAESKNQLES